jgi:ADP-ribosylglycohydrolase
VIAAVNHKGDSDSAGVVTGNILGALLGYGRIDEKWKPIWNSQTSSWKWRMTCVMDDKCMNTAIMRIRLGLESI